MKKIFFLLIAVISVAGVPDTSTAEPPLQVPIPLEKLARGSYLLSISAERADGVKTRSDLVFRIR